MARNITRNALSLADQLALIEWLKRTLPKAEPTEDSASLANRATKETRLPVTAANLRHVMKAAGLFIPGKESIEDTLASLLRRVSELESRVKALTVEVSKWS